MKKIRLFLLFTLLHSQMTAQNEFLFYQPVEKVEIPFTLTSNLIVLDVKVNGVKLNLIFDTGVKQTILINLKSVDSLNFKNVKKQKFSGIGKDQIFIEGLSTVHNRLNISSKIINPSATLYVITGAEFHFSETIGRNINGFIGGELIKDFVVQIDYKHQKLIFYKHRYFDNHKLKKLHSYNLSIIKGKPYIYTKVQTQKRQAISDSIKLLIDTGNSDALWIFDRNKIKFPANKKTIRDYFGLGFSGYIEGDRAKIHRFYLDKRYKFKNVYIGIPDSIYFSHITAQNPFDGLLGNEILKRFYVWLDYKAKKMYLKKYPSNYRKAFAFNDIGLNLIYDGKIPVKEKRLVTQYNSFSKDGNINIYISESYEYRYKLVDRLVINYIRKDSPADRAGLMKGDILLKINDVDVYQYNLDELEKKFFYHNRKHLTFLIHRKGLTLTLKVTNTSQL